MKWRLIEQETYSAPMNMAIDHAIYESVANGRELPTIRFYKWENNSVSIGAYQNPKEINLDECKKHNVDVVRRMTGGRAVFHSRDDFTYSVIAHIRAFNYSIQSAYRQICLCMINALKEFGIKATLENKNDILVKGKKISGNAAKLMNKGVYLQHGTLIYNMDLSVMPKLLNISEETVKEKATSVIEHKKIPQQKVYQALKDNFIKNKEFKIDELSKYEIMRAEDLARTQYNFVQMPSGTLLRNKGTCYVERGG